MKKLIFYSVRELLDEFFEDDHVKAAFMARGLIGTFASPSTPGTAYVLGHHVIGESAGGQGVWGYVRGGMGGLADALVKALRAAGGELMLEAPVRELIVKESRVTGAILEDGTTIESQLVLSNADPKQTMLKFVGEEHLDHGLVTRLREVKDEGCVVKLNAALTGLPRYNDYPTPPGPHLEGITGIGPSPDYYEHAYFDALMGGFSRKPLLRVVYHTVTDPSLAPPHYVRLRPVLSLSSQARELERVEGKGGRGNLQHTRSLCSRNSETHPELRCHNSVGYGANILLAKREHFPCGNLSFSNAFFPANP
jgi:phytoene dehydrogenase-like protein